MHDQIAAAHGANGRLEALITVNERKIELNALFAIQGATPQTELVKPLGVQLAANCYIMVNTEQKTNVDRVYAAGAVTQLHSHLVSTAVHEGATAAVAANHALHPAALR